MERPRWLQVGRVPPASPPGLVAAAGEADRFTIDLDAGQTVTAVLASADENGRLQPETFQTAPNRGPYISGAVC